MKNTEVKTAKERINIFLENLIKHTYAKTPQLKKKMQSKIKFVVSRIQRDTTKVRKAEIQENKKLRRAIRDK
jgi:hypothetical protein